MKKFLFTLCAVLVGFAANADGLSLRVVDNSGAPCTEVHAKAGDVINMHIELTALDGIVTGLQMQYYMKGNGTTVYDPENGPVVIAKVGGSYLRKEGMSNLNGNAMANNLNPVDSEWGAYRIVCTNTTLNMFWLTDPQPVADWLGDDVTALFEDYDPPYTNAMFTLGNVIAFRVKVNSGWEDEYAVFDFDEAFTKFSGLQNQQIADEGMSLKIINDDYAPAVTLADPTISFNQTDDTHMTVTVACETAGSTLIVNGVAQANPYTYEVTRPDVYTAQTVTVVAQSVLGEETSAEVTKSQAFEPVEDQPTAAKPEITFVETKNDKNEVTQVVVKIENWTSATINDVTYTNTRGDVKTFTANYVAEQPIHVEAVNNPGNPYIANDNEADYTLNKLAPIASEAAQFSTTMDDEYVYVTATGPGVVLYDQNGNVVDPQPLKLPRNEYSETSTGYTVTVSATTLQEGEEGQYTQTTTPYEVEVPNKAKPADPTEKTPEPTASGRTPDGVHAYYVTITDVNPNAVIYYRVYKDGQLITVGEDGWVVYDGEFGYTEDGSYRVEMYAVAPGMLPSDQIAYEFAISPTTGLVDVMNGKTVSNVRYFNMAGQEMQEANGMTIVVTTYTDGTSSAVKVMK